MTKHARLPLLLLVLLASASHAQFLMDSVWIPMPDTTWLAADVYTTNWGEAKPTVFVQTPYDKSRYRAIGPPLGDTAYVYVIMDWRGRFASRWAFRPDADIGWDGYHATEWIAAQPWSNGAIGTYGQSALGDVQYRTAKHHPPHLVCAAPLVRPMRDNYFMYYPGGVRRKDLIDMHDSLGFSTEERRAHQTLDAWWQASDSSVQCWDSIAVPMFLLSGWWDNYPDHVWSTFDSLRALSDPSVRSQHKILFGPWSHLTVGLVLQGQWFYPTVAAVPEEEALQFFDFYLRSIPNGWEARAPIRYFVLGDNVLVDGDVFPPPDAVTRRLYLHDGTMSLALPVENVAWDLLSADPHFPVPTLGGATMNDTLTHGPVDLRPLHGRPDVLLYTTTPLSEAVTVAGPVRAEIWVSSNRTDTDIALLLADVYPDGRSQLLVDGVRRLRFRESYSSPQLAMPDSIYCLSIDLQNLAVTFPAYHAIRLYVCASNYPRFDLNLNNGGEMYVPGDTLIAENRIHRDVLHASYLALSVAPASGLGDRDFAGVPQSHTLQVYPNPFNSSTEIRYELRQSGHVAIRIYDLLGRMVTELENDLVPAGSHRARFDANDLSSGVYICRLQTASASCSEKIVLLK